MWAVFFAFCNANTGFVHILGNNAMQGGSFHLTNGREQTQKNLIRFHSWATIFDVINNRLPNII